MAGIDIAAWLRDLGLGQYRQTFEQNDIGGEVLQNLTADDLKELGIASVGHRRTLLDAIAALRAEKVAGPAAAVSPAVSAERRQLTLMFCDRGGCPLYPGQLSRRPADREACKSRGVKPQRGRTSPARFA